MARRTRYLSRSDVRQQADKPTDSLILRYDGRGIDFDDYLYGYPEGTFFAVQMAEVPWPEHIAELAIETAIQIDAVPEARRLQRAVAEALIAEAMVEAPDHISALTDDDVPEWHESDLRELERRHRIADARVAEITRLVETDLKLRASGLKTPSLQLPRVEDFIQPPPPSVYGGALDDIEEAVAELPEPFRAEAAEELAEAIVDEFEDAPAPGSMTVQRAKAAVAAARADELPQRLPAGARRRLRKMAPAQYVAFGEVLDSRVDLCAAMADARAMARKDQEAVVIDYDGEWPVVVRRYGQGGRTIYKVEDALRRHGIEVPKKIA